MVGNADHPRAGSGIFKESVVSADDGAVFALLQRLDRKYRGVEEEDAAALVGMIGREAAATATIARLTPARSAGTIPTAVDLHKVRRERRGRVARRSSACAAAKMNPKRQTAWSLLR